MPPRITCPTCHTQIEWTAEAPWRPFCSERCKQIDLGAWAEERYVIATPAPVDEDSIATERMPPPI